MAKKNLRVLIAVVITVLVMAGLAFYGWHRLDQKNEAEKDTLQKQSDDAYNVLDIYTQAATYSMTQSDISTWADYTDPVAKISFKYPPSFHVAAKSCDEGSESVGVYLTDLPDRDLCGKDLMTGETFFAFSLNPMSGDMLQQEQDWLKNLWPEKGDAGNVSVAGKTWKKSLSKYDPASTMDYNMNSTSLSRLDGDKLLQLWWPNTDDLGHYVPLIDQALATLKLN